MHLLSDQLSATSFMKLSSFSFADSHFPLHLPHKPQVTDVMTIFFSLMYTNCSVKNVKSD